MLYPVLFTYKAPVFGNGFLADISVTGGRVAVSIETEGFWFNGVNPGGVAADGKTFETAHAAFRSSMTTVLYDIATESNSFDTFRDSVQAFFNEVNDETAVEWETAVAMVRQNSNLTVAGLRRESAETPLVVTVVMRQQRDFTSQLNTLEAQADQLATAA